MENEINYGYTQLLFPHFSRAPGPFLEFSVFFFVGVDQVEGLLPSMKSLRGGAIAIERVLEIATGWALTEAQRQLSEGAQSVGEKKEVNPPNGCWVGGIVGGCCCCCCFFFFWGGGFVVLVCGLLICAKS